jgi:hypothetical protein
VTMTKWSTELLQLDRRRLLQRLYLKICMSWASRPATRDVVVQSCKGTRNITRIFR